MHATSSHSTSICRYRAGSQTSMTIIGQRSIWRPGSSVGVGHATNGQVHRVAAIAEVTNFTCLASHQMVRLHRRPPVHLKSRAVSSHGTVPRVVHHCATATQSQPHTSVPPRRAAHLEAVCTLGAWSSIGNHLARVGIARHAAEW
jgi:hypothetical protein